MPMDRAEWVAQVASIFAEERAELAAELHDGLVQNVVGARMWLNSLHPAAISGSDETRAALEVIQHALDQASRDARNIISELSHSSDAAANRPLLVSRMIDYWRRRGVHVEHHAPIELELKDPSETIDALDAILALLLAWLFKYAAVDSQADTVSLRVNFGDQLDVEFTHNGRIVANATPAVPPTRLGCVKRLVELLDGRFDVNSGPSGQTVTLLIGDVLGGSRRTEN